MNHRGYPERLKTLSTVLKGDLFFDTSPAHQAVLRAYATDASVYQEKPLAVALPACVSDLKTLIKFAREENTTLIPRAAGTSLAGQVVGSGVVVDISRYFNKILETNHQEGWVRVQPGVIRDDLNKQLATWGLMFGPETSTASRAMIGGMIGNNSSGLHSIVWGDTRSKLLEATVLLDDGSEVVFKPLTIDKLEKKLRQTDREGEVYRRIDELLRKPGHDTAIRENYPKPSITRRNTGYALDLLLDHFEKGIIDLCQLLAGSEGTLGIITEAKLQLMPLPPAEIALLCIHCTSLQETLEANIIALKHAPQASELVDKYILNFTKGHPLYRHHRAFIEGDPEAILLVEFRAEQIEDAYLQAEGLRQELRERGLGYAHPLVTGHDTEIVWEVRKAGLGLIRNLPGDTQPVNLIEDCAVDPRDLPAYATDVTNILQRHGLEASYYAHAGAGELHIEPLINLKTPLGKKLFRQVLAETVEVVKKYRGSLSGEHGDGRLRGEFIPAVLGKQVMILLKKVKHTFDPQNIFNQGKITDTPPMDEHLRYNLVPSKDPAGLVFDFSAQESILRMAEKCSGSGDCRKTHFSGGTMCPSYMATREEKHTTRARANVLRQFLSDPYDSNPLIHEEIKEVMDLCLSCKACKTECPSAVDITKMKAEFLQQYYDHHGVPFRTWIIGNFTRAQRLASWLPYIYNSLIENKYTSHGIKNLLGFAPKRSLPRVGSITYRRWLRKMIKTQTPHTNPVKTVYLFCDEFTNYNDLRVGKATYKLLHALGYRVLLATHYESGRTYLSKGLLRKARSVAEKNVRRLKDVVSIDTPLIGIEPSAILTFRDEYPELVSAEWIEDARKLAKNTFLIEEFLAAEMDAGRIPRGRFTGAHQKVKLHAHCYQKALQINDLSERILRQPTGFDVEVIPSGCCGMAGSFGYEKEHYDVSMQIGELVLFPTVRKTEEHILIAAPGTSCRHQILDGTSRESFHPVEILLNALTIP